MDQGGWVADGLRGRPRRLRRRPGDDEGGAQLCVYRHGEKVVDLWAGRDKVNDRPYGEDTITVIMSCTKGATAACVHILAERGLIDYEAPVADYWPEFAAGRQGRRAHLAPAEPFRRPAGRRSGERRHRQRHALSRAPYRRARRHGAGLDAGRVLPLPPDHLRLAAQRGRAAGDRQERRPRSSPRRSPAPLGLDFWIGLPAAEEPRVAPHFQPTPGLDDEQLTAFIAGMGIDVETRLAKVVLNSFKHTGELIETMNNREARAAEVPAGNGIADAALAGQDVRRPDRRGRRRAPDQARDAGEGAHAAHRRHGPAGRLRQAARAARRSNTAWASSSPARATPMLGQGSFGHAGAGGRIGFAHPESGTAGGLRRQHHADRPLRPRPALGRTGRGAEGSGGG